MGICFIGERNFEEFILEVWHLTTLLSANPLPHVWALLASYPCLGAQYLTSPPVLYLSTVHLLRDSFSISPKPLTHVWDLSISPVLLHVLILILSYILYVAQSQFHYSSSTLLYLSVFGSKVRQFCLHREREDHGTTQG